jgi:hypothetical protein
LPHYEKHELASIRSKQAINPERIAHIEDIRGRVVIKIKANAEIDLFGVGDAASEYQSHKS